MLRGTGPAARGTVEAFHGSPQFNGLLLVVGFVVLLILLVLSHGTQMLLVPNGAQAGGETFSALAGEFAQGRRCSPITEEVGT